MTDTRQPELISAPYQCIVPREDQLSPARAKIGEVVARRLRGAAGVGRMPAEQADIFYAHDFLSPADRAGLIERIDAGCYPSPLFLAESFPNYRTSDSCDLDTADPFVAAIERRIAGLLGIMHSHAEPLQGQRYRPGQTFRIHPDFFYVDQSYWHDVKHQGGQRTWTAMIYLDRPEAGGATWFPYLEFEVMPTPGMLLAWNNMDADGAPNDFTLHEGRPVAAGVKHIVTKWFRERPFEPVAAL